MAQQTFKKDKLQRTISKTHIRTPRFGVVNDINVCDTHRGIIMAVGTSEKEAKLIAHALEFTWQPEKFGYKLVN